MNPEPKVTLLTWTKNPLETVYAVWMASKNEDPLVRPEKIQAANDARDRGTELHIHRTLPTQEEIETLFKAVIAQRIPIGEHVDFVFMLENVSVSWREQAVRHRIGVEISPERLGIDLIPNLAESSFWSQSMRIQDMGRFADSGAYRLPATIKGTPLEVDYHDTMNTIQQMYKRLVLAGVPMEDARELIPLGAQHRISWKLNIGALQHIIGKRGCWILQLGIWGPVIMGMVEELATKVHPVFRDLVCPPCIQTDTDKDHPYKGCIYMEECRRRLTGDDKLPPCPLHLNYETEHDPHFEFKNGKMKVPMLAQMIERAEQYRKFWGRDPYTGEEIR